MIPLDAKVLLQEVDAAEKVRKKHLKNAAVMVKRFVGNYYREDLRGKPVPENLVFSFIAQVLPQLIFDNPQVTCSAKRAVSHKPIADFMRQALNGWIKEVQLRDELEAACVDMLFGYGVMKVGLEARGDFAADPQRGVMEKFTMDALRPYAVRVDPECFLMDSQARDLASARILGHEFARDLDDLRGDDRYDQEAVGRLTAEMDADRRGAAPIGPAKDGSDLRRRVKLYELYLPEHGEICTLALNPSGEGDFIRKPRKYVGHDRGPYVVFGVYAVPNSPYPLSPIAAMYEQFAELNAHASAAAREAAAHKRFTIVNSHNKEAKAGILAVESGGVLALPNFSASEAMAVEIGGTSQHRLDYIERMRDRVDRVSGMSDSARGRTSGGTATEASIANDSHDTRIEYVHLKYAESAKRVLENVGWHLYYDPAVVMPVSDRNEQTGEATEGLFLGGVQEGQEDADWLDFFLDIEPFSMRRIDPVVQAQQAMQVYQTAMQIAPLIAQFPWMNWRSILDGIGEANQLPDFAARVLSDAGMQMISGGVAGLGMPGQLAGLDGRTPPPPGANAQIREGMAGRPVLAQDADLGTGGGASGGGAGPAMSPAMSAAMPQLAKANPAVAAGQRLGYLPGGGQ